MIVSNLPALAFKACYDTDGLLVSLANRDPIIFTQTLKIGKIESNINIVFNAKE